LFPDTITEEQAQKLLQCDFDAKINAVKEKWNWLEDNKLLAVALLCIQYGENFIAKETMLGEEFNLMNLKMGYSEINVKTSWLSLVEYEGKKHDKFVERRNYEYNLFMQNYN
jgi:hypothetical protein